MSRSVLVVDDEPGIIEIASAYLRRDGFDVRTATTGRRALDSVATQAPDLVVLDLMLPDLSGEEVCASLRRHTAVPILMLTAKAAESDRLRGLALGADDYLVKPFSPRELVARVRAILRRVPGSDDPPMDLLVVDGGRLEVDLAAHEARLAGRVMPLTATEFRLLATLARQPRRAAPCWTPRSSRATAPSSGVSTPGRSSRRRGTRSASSSSSLSARVAPHRPMTPSGRSSIVPTSSPP